MWLTKTQARIFQRVRRAGQTGIASTDLLVNEKMTINTVKQHIYHINNVLLSTDWKIKHRGGLYRLVNVG